MMKWVNAEEQDIHDQITYVPIRRKHPLKMKTITQIRELFSFYDKNNDGVLTIDELK
jgi:Ca2+-binding EF-hand superfamily protein